MTTMIGNNKHVKQLNRLQVLDIIRKRDGVSRKELAKITGLTPPAITGIVKDLLKMRLVLEGGLGSSQGGRKPVCLSFNAGVAYVLGIEISRDSLAYGFTDMNSMPSEVSHMSCDTSNPSVVSDLLMRLINEVLSSNKSKKFIGVGIAIAGIINIEQARVIRSVNLGAQWNGYALLKELKDRGLRLPVFMDNNSNVAVLAERMFDLGTESVDLIYINVGDGISAGMIIDGDLLNGNKGFAGELGHIVVQPEGGLLCNCGNRGCVETIASLPSILRKFNMEMPYVAEDDPAKQYWLAHGVRNVEDLVALAQLDSEYAQKMFRYFCEHLSIAVSTVINLLSPEVVIMGGKMIGIMELYLEELNRRIANHSFPEIFAHTELKLSNMREEASVSGACALALGEVLSLSGDVFFGDGN